jgi:hypothetical protein
MLWDDVDWIHLAHVRDEWWAVCESDNEPMIYI